MQERWKRPSPGQGAGWLGHIPALMGGVKESRALSEGSVEPVGGAEAGQQP